MTTRESAWPAGTPCWVDLLTTDQEGAQDFYRALFGWDIEVGGPETNHYGLASTGGREVAGLMTMTDAHHPPVWSTYVATADAAATAAAVDGAGGSVITPAMDVMDLGRMAMVQAPSGGVFGVWQAGTHTGFGIANEPNAVTWNEFLTRDYEGAKDFYAAVFGATYTTMADAPDFRYATIEVEGTTVGGIGSMPAQVPDRVPPHWRVYFQVEDTDAAVTRVLELGGSVLRPASDQPYGRQADVADPQGAMFTVITPGPRGE